MIAFMVGLFIGCMFGFSCACVLFVLATEDKIAQFEDDDCR